MQKKAVWLFAGGDMQEAAARKIVDWGYNLILTDMNPDCICRKYATEFVYLDTFDIEGNLKEAKKLSKKYNIAAVFTGAADCHETVACVAKLLGLPGIDPKIAYACRYKFQTREILSKAGLLQPKFKKVKTLQEAKKAVAKIGLPVVLKATDNAASRGFSEILTMEDLNQEAFDRALKNSVAGTGFVLVEERLSPIDGEIAEQSVETLWYNGKMHWLNWVDRLFRKDALMFKNLKNDIYSNIAWGVEIGHINPAVHSEETTNKVKKVLKQTGIVLGLGKQKGGHILKADIMLTKKGPCVIEPTLRLSGGWDSSLTTPERGGDFVGGALKMALGEKLTPSLFKKYFEYKNPEIFASILTQIPQNAKDCAGRLYALGRDSDREKSLIMAYEKIKRNQYVSMGNQPRANN